MCNDLITKSKRPDPFSFLPFFFTLTPLFFTPGVLTPARTVWNFPHCFPESIKCVLASVNEVFTISKPNVKSIYSEKAERQFNRPAFKICLPQITRTTNSLIKAVYFCSTLNWGMGIFEERTVNAFPDPENFIYFSKLNRLRSMVKAHYEE